MKVFVERSTLAATSRSPYAMAYFRARPGAVRRLLFPEGMTLCFEHVCLEGQSVQINPKSIAFNTARVRSRTPNLANTFEM